MPKLSFILSLLVIPLFPLSLYAQTTVAKPGTGTISGRVLLNGEPARDVAVVMQQQVSGGPPNQETALRARTDSSGRFQIGAVAAGKYSIMAFAPGAISPDDSSFSNWSGKPLNVSDGESVENLELTLKRGGVIAGRITDAQGRPLVDERVSIDRIGKDGRPQQYYGSPYAFEMYNTDDRGVYRIYGLPEGRYRVSVGVAQGPGSITFGSNRAFYPKTFYPDTPDESQAKVIDVTEGFEASNIDITVGEMKRSYDIYGRVVDENGQPVAGVSLSRGTLRDGRLLTYGSGGERSGANGEFRLIGVVPGAYGIFANSDGDSDYYSDPAMCEVGESDVHGVEVKVRLGMSISGIVVIEGGNDPKMNSRLSQINIRAFTRPAQQGPGPMGPMRPTRVNPDGSFQVRGLKQGKLELSVMPTPGLALSRIEFNGTPAPREGVDLNPGENITGVKVFMSRATLSLRGEVKVVGIPSPPRLMAIARRTDLSTQNSASAQVDARGQFIIENLSPGEYELRVSFILNSNDDRPDPQVMRAFSMSSQKVTLSGENQPPVTLVIDMNATERKERNQ
jgi:protocatechuate 3,4-dioxygenase beta subunit